MGLLQPPSPHIPHTRAARYGYNNVIPSRPLLKKTKSEGEKIKIGTKSYLERARYKYNEVMGFSIPSPHIFHTRAAIPSL
jgi:hypothetical protein